jgi:hypothetical protein
MSGIQYFSPSKRTAVHINEYASLISNKRNGRPQKISYHKAITQFSGSQEPDDEVMERAREKLEERRNKRRRTSMDWLGADDGYNDDSMRASDSGYAPDLERDKEDDSEDEEDEDCEEEETPEDEDSDEEEMLETTRPRTWAEFIYDVVGEQNALSPGPLRNIIRAKAKITQKSKREYSDKKKNCLKNWDVFVKAVTDILATKSRNDNPCSCNKTVKQLPAISFHGISPHFCACINFRRRLLYTFIRYLRSFLPIQRCHVGILVARVFSIFAQEAGVCN